MRCPLRSLIMAVGLTGALGLPAHAAGSPRQAITVTPQVGGQGTSFAIRYPATYIGDDGPDDGDQSLTLFGPPGSPCEGDGGITRPAFELSGIFFGDGPAVFRVGEDPRRAGAHENAAAWRLVQPWCPGRYDGLITEDYVTAGAKQRDVGTFSFRVRRTRRSPGALVARRYSELERLGGDFTVYDRRYAVHPRRGAAHRQFEVTFPVARSQTVEVDVVPPSPRCTRRLRVPLHVRRGRATIAFSSRLRTGRRSPRRYAFRTGRRTCIGTWSVFLQDSFGDVGLSFTVT